MCPVLPPEPSFKMNTVLFHIIITAPVLLKLTNYYLCYWTLSVVYFFKHYLYFKQANAFDLLYVTDGIISLFIFV